MTLSELQQATVGFLAGDWLLELLANPWYWVGAVLGAVLFGYSRHVRLWVLKVCGTLLLQVVVLLVLLFQPVSASWVSAHSDLASKAAQHLNWQKTDPSTFSRFEVYRLSLAIEDDVRTAQTLVRRIVNAGGAELATEAVVMSALAHVHRGK